MNNNSNSVKSNVIGTPKTPGGISKSLLTPCRRLGLSRNWRKNGPSPFVSPLSGSGEVKQENIEAKKRKLCDVDNEPSTPIVNDGVIKIEEIHRTPIRNVDLPRRKKSKRLLSTLTKSEKTTNIDTLSPNKGPEEFSMVDPENQTNENNIKEIPIEKLEEIIEKSPNNLTKECIVVIQKKIFEKEDVRVKCGEYIPTSGKLKDSSQILFDSDTDDVPLSNLNKKEISIVKSLEPINEDDFVETNIKPKQENKLSSTKMNLKTNFKTQSNLKNIILNIETSKSSSQSSIDDEDFDFEDKRTILIKKTYDKVNKPSKAKSTGSITQKDIDKLKARIEAKKKLLLAKAMTEDTKELRDLIKKWQKGCQDALMELMDLMKTKLPDKQNMDYSEILQSLKIPPSLVGYDLENDCFNTPEDANIILAKFNDL